MASIREALIGSDIVVDESVLSDHAILVKDGLIEAVLPVGQLPSDVSRRDLGRGFLTAGLIDIHTHGAGGRGFNEGDPDGTRVALEELLRAGVTTVLPTLASAPIEDLTSGLEVLANLNGVDTLPRVPGAHLEGPYFAGAQRGAQDPSSLRSPADGSVDRLLDHADAIAMISFAPELPGAVALTERLVEKGIVAAAGHTDGRDEDLFACQRAGLSHVIHVFSGQSTTIRRGPWRQPGMLEATLASDDLTVEMIGDGKHLPATLMKLAYRCLAGRLCLVSDSTPGAGMPDGSVYRMGDMDYVIDDGVGMTSDRSAFGGSTTLLPAMIVRVIADLGIGLPEAIAMATIVPARAARLSKVGRISVGYHADFTLFNTEMKALGAAVGGRWDAVSRSND